MWQWSRYLCKQAAARGKTPLFLNLDETSVPVVFSGNKGTVMVRGGRAAWVPPRLSASAAETRMHFTHVAIVCDVPEIQPLLPQVLFVAAASLNSAEMASLADQLPNNVFVKRLPSGWNNSVQHKIIIKILGMVLTPYLTQYQPILSFDAAPLHLTVEVLAEIQAASMWFLVIPARATWLLQPLDTHVFLKYKRFIKRRFAETLMAASDDSKAKSMIKLVVEAARYVLQAHEWQAAFQQNGVWRDQCGLRATLKRELQYDDTPEVADSMPTPEQLRLCWPRNRVFDEGAIVSFLPVAPPVPTPGAVHASPSSSTPAAAAAVPKALPKKRLRSKSACDLYG